MPLWLENARQIVAFIEQSGYEKVDLLGTSGGAYVGINVALERPDLIHRIVADSFDGRTIRSGFNEDLIKEREFASNHLAARLFYQWCLGKDWRRVVKQDTEALLLYKQKDLPIFSKELTQLLVPILLVGSEQDEMLRKDLRSEYDGILGEVQCGSMHLFEKGNHPAVLSNAEAFAEITTKFLNQMAME